MNCPQCGAPNNDGSRFCKHCGSDLFQAQEPQQNVNQSYQQEQPPVYQQPNPQQYQQAQYYPPQQNTMADKYNGHPMGWYKFLIYFALFANAALNVLSGIRSISGIQYGEDSRTVYGVFPGLKTIDVIFGVVLFLLAAYAIVTRFQLSGLKKNGPAMLYGVYILNMICSIIYIIAVYAVVSSSSAINVGSLFGSQIVSSFVVPIVFLIINIVYFGKRKDIFVN